MTAKQMKSLVSQIKDARKTSNECLQTYISKRLIAQANYASGQLDSLDAVLKWIKETKGAK